jgi:hypothetical protein
MRHHPHHIAPLVADAGDRVHRSVRVPAVVEPPLWIGITQNHLAMRFHLLERPGRCEVIAFAMSDGNPEHLAGAGGARERRVGLLDAQMHLFAAVFQAAVAQHRAGQETRLEENLESIADAEHRATTFGERSHRAHDR